MVAIPQPVWPRFNARYAISETGCWEWTGALNNKGYGKLCVNGKQIFAHRASYALHVGPIPPGSVICHLCDNPRCVNPDHLFAGTMLDNTRDMIAKGRAVHPTKEFCVRGHALSGANLYFPPSGGRQCRVCKSDRKRERRDE
jgi:hypothetical protein